MTTTPPPEDTTDLLGQAWEAAQRRYPGESGLTDASRGAFLVGWSAALSAATPGVVDLRPGGDDARVVAAEAEAHRAETADAAAIECLAGMTWAELLATFQERDEARAALAVLRAEAEQHALANDGCVPGAAYRDLAAAHAALRERIEALAETADEYGTVTKTEVRAALADTAGAPRCSTCNDTRTVPWEPGAHRTSEDDEQPCPDCAPRTDEARCRDCGRTDGGCDRVVVPDVERHVMAGEPGSAWDYLTPVVPDSTDLRIENGWLVEVHDGCTCGGSGVEWAPHLPECGLVPLENLAALPGWPVVRPDGVSAEQAWDEGVQAANQAWAKRIGWAVGPEHDRRDFPLTEPNRYASTDSPAGGAA